MENLPIQAGDWSAINDHLGRLESGSRSLIFLPVGSRAAPYYPSSAQLSDGVLEGGTSRLVHTALCSFNGLRLVYGNWYNSNGETDGPNDIVVAAAAELSNSGKPLPVTFFGQRRITISPGGFAISDPIGGFSCAKGALFETRTFVQVQQGDKFPLGSDQTASSNGEGHNYASPAGADLTGQAAAAVATVNATRVYGPCMFLATPTNRVTTPPCVLISGDSIAAGTGDGSTFTDWGYLKRWLNNSYPFQSLAFPGETPGVWSQNSGQNRFRRACLIEVAAYTHIICQDGINSLSLGLAGLQAVALGMWTFFATYGLPVYQTTLTPWTTTTDAWATIANQTVTANETTRTGYNDWVRAGAPISGGVAVAIGTAGALTAGQTGHPLTTYLEAADQAESTRNSGKWRVDGGAHTADGIHPNALGHQTIAAGLPSVVSTIGAGAT